MNSPADFRHCDIHDNYWSGDEGCLVPGCRRSAEDPLPFRNAGPSGLHDPSEETQWARRAG